MTNIFGPRHFLINIEVVCFAVSTCDKGKLFRGLIKQ